MVTSHWSRGAETVIHISVDRVNVRDQAVRCSRLRSIRQDTSLISEPVRSNQPALFLASVAETSVTVSAPSGALSTLKFRTLNPKPQALNLAPQTLTPKPQTPNPKPYARNLKS